jgi:hypothetical protein
VVFTVIVTANHYVVDCIAALCLFMVCCAVVAWLERVLLDAPTPTKATTVSRRPRPSIRDLDYPLVFAGTVGVLQATSLDQFQQVVGVVMLICAVGVLSLARSYVQRGYVLGPRIPLAEWWAGFLFVAGTTTVGTVLGANAADRRHIASLVWLVAVCLPLIGRIQLNWKDIRQVFRPFAPEGMTSHAMGQELQAWPSDYGADRHGTGIASDHPGYLPLPIKAQ